MLLVRKHYGSRRLIRIIDIILEEEYETTWTRLGNRTVRGRVGGFVHSVHRILHMLSDAAGMLRRNLRIYCSRAGGCQFQSTIVPITCPPFSQWISVPEKTVPVHSGCPWKCSLTVPN